MFGVTSDELDECLREQQRTNASLGWILREKGLLARRQVGQILEAQAKWTAEAVQAQVPGGRLPLTTSLSLCLPAYNEEGVIEDTLDAACAILPSFVERFEVIVVDDGSEDRTGDVVARYAEKDPRVRLIRHETNGGYGAAVTSGLRAARCQLVTFTDSDGQFSLLDLSQLLIHLNECDVVAGYRYCRADHLGRCVNAWAWTQLIRLLLGIHIRDLDCAFKLFRRETIERFQLTATGACISAEIMAQCVQSGLRVQEAAVNHYPRRDGDSSGAAWHVIMRAFRELPRLMRYRKRPPAVEPLAASAGAGLPGNPRPQNGSATLLRPFEPDRPAPLDDVDDLPLTVCMLAACPFPANHGTPGSIREMSEAIAERGHAVHIVTYHFGEEIPVVGPRLHRIKPLTRESSIIVGPTARRPLYDLQMVFKTLEVIRRYRPAVIHAHGYEAALAAWLCRMVTGVPVVYSGHNTMADELPSYNFFRPRWVAVVLAKMLDAFVPARADRLIPHSENMDRFFQRRKLGRRTEPVVNFGIKLDNLNRGDGQSVRLRYELGDGPVVLYTGVMNEFQRLDLLLEAMVSVVRRMPTARLFVVATIPNEKFFSEFRRDVERLGLADHVVLTEPQPLESVQELLAAADVAVVPRPGAPGFPIKLLNYMAAKKPCVLFSSSASGLVHGEDVFLASSDTGRSLAEAVIEVLDDDELRRRLGDNALRFVERHHDRRQTARQVYAAYMRTLLANSGLSRCFYLRLPAFRAKRFVFPRTYSAAKADKNGSARNGSSQSGDGLRVKEALKVDTNAQG